MFRNILTTLVFGSLLSCSTTDAGNIEASRYERQVSTIFKEGLHYILYTVHQENTAREKEIYTNYQSAVNSNQNWYRDFYESLAKGKKAEYSEHMGITKNEYDTVLAILGNNFIPIKSAITVIVGDSTIRFNAGEKLSVLKALSINLKDSSVKFEDHTFSFVDTLSVQNIYGNEELSPAFKFKHADSLSSHRIVFGILKISGNTFLEIKLRRLSPTGFGSEYRLSIFID